jgi:hypothetical protein
MSKEESWTFGHHGSFDGKINIGIIKDNKRSIAA